MNPRLPRLLLPAAGLLAAPLFAEIAAPATPAAPAHVPPAPPRETPGAESAAKDAPPPPAPQESPEAVKLRETRKQIDRMILEKLRIEAEAELAAIKTRRARAAGDTERAKLETESALLAAKTGLEALADNEARADIERRLALAAARASLAGLEESLRLKKQETVARLAKTELDHHLAVLAADATIAKAEKAAAKVIHAPAAGYATNPLANGVLRITDRQVRISGNLDDDSALMVIERLNFLNQRDPAAPIFVIVEDSMGGSALAAYQIIKAIESSRAPVHALARGIVGGAAAAVVSAAPRSYALDGTVMAQTLAVARASGNLPNLRDSLRTKEEWFARIYGPVAKRMGITPQEYMKLILAKNAAGSWTEFGPECLKLKWVDQVLTGITEESVEQLTDTPAPSRLFFHQDGTDHAPGDVLFLYQPNATR